MKYTTSTFFSASILSLICGGVFLDIGIPASGAIFIVIGVIFIIATLVKHLES